MLTWVLHPNGEVKVYLSLIVSLGCVTPPTTSTNLLPGLVNQERLTAEQSMDLHKMLLRWFSQTSPPVFSKLMSSSSRISHTKTNPTARKKASRKGLGRS